MFKDHTESHIEYMRYIRLIYPYPLNKNHIQKREYQLSVRFLRSIGVQNCEI